VALTALAVGSLPWLVPSVLHTVYADPAGVAAFAARADTPFGTLGSLLMLGGMWNADTVPKAYGGAWSGPWLAVVLAAIVSYAVLARRRWPGLGPAALVGLLLASIGVTAPGRDLLRAAIGLWPGFAILRDAQQFVAPLALVEALGLGLAVSWAMHPRSFGIKKEGHPTTAGQNPSRTGEMPGFPWKIRVWWKKRWTIVHQMFRGTRIFQDLSGIWRSRTAGRSFPGRIRACGRFWSTTVHRILPGTRILPDPPAAHRAVAPTRTTAPTSTSTRPSPEASTSPGTSPGPTTSPAPGTGTGTGPGTGTGTGTSSPSPDRLGLAIGIAALLAPVLLLPGLAWGAAGRLRPAAYPQNYLAAARMIDSSRAPGAVLLLPWAAYRTLPWNHDEPVLDPWPRLLSRPVIWNDGTQVGPLKMTPDYQAAEDLDSKITSNEPLTSTLQKAGIRFVVVDSGPTQAQRLPGCTTVFIRPGLAVYEVPPE
jgi:hypothetical protein